VRQHAARQKVSELLLHECGQRGAVRLTPGCLEEGVEVLIDHAVEHGVLGVARPVVAGVEGHSGGIRALCAHRQCPKMDTPEPWGSPRQGSLFFGVCDANPVVLGDAMSVVDGQSQSRKWPGGAGKLGFPAIVAGTRGRAAESRVAGGDERSEHALDAAERPRRTMTHSRWARRW
jgi:hypothetical protein